MKLFFKYKNFKELLSYFLWIWLFIILVSSCKTTKYVSEEDYLLTKYSIKCNNRKVDKKELHNYIKQKPNKKILGFRFHLSLYNLSGKNREKGISKWLRNIGEAPVILDNYLTDKSTQQLKTYLNNKGYYDSNVTDTIIYKKEKKNKARVVYNVKVNEPHRINNINYFIEDTTIRNTVYQDTINSLIERGDVFDIDVLQLERIRLEYLLRNEGYYNFSKEYIYYEADSTKGNYLVDLVLGIKPYLEVNEDSKSNYVRHKKYFINNVFIYSDFDPKKELSGEIISEYDTLLYNRLHILYQEELSVKPTVIAQSNYIIPKELYHLGNVNNTYKHFNSLKIYKYVNIKFFEKENVVEDSIEYGLLDCFISLTLSTKQSFSVENELTNSAGNIGTAVNLVYQHKNLFKGAEEFNLKLKGAIEAIKEVDKNKFKNALELGSEASIKFPKFLFPVLESEKFVKKYSPKSYISLAYNYQRRPDYTRAISNLAFGYNWSSSKDLRHNIQPIELNAVQLPFLDPAFEEFIDTTGSPYLQNSFNDHLISITSYSLIFNNQNIKKNTDFVYFRLNTETAGNIISGINTLANEPQVDGNYKLFGIEYAQYFKIDFDLSYHRIIDKNNSIVYRLFAGVGYPYGNSNTLPFEKRYFSGGANSIRAWQVRSLGPGSYNGEVSYRFPNQAADIKLEANIEYRFKLFWLIEGALFVDAGNIWDIYSYDEREGGIFDKKFLKDIAIGTGIGTRFDFDFFLFRLDFGIKARDPSIVVDPSDYYSPTNKWVLGKQKLKFGDTIVLNIGIGYPF